jgi:hypothetical protein
LPGVVHPPEPEPRLEPERPQLSQRLLAEHRVGGRRLVRRRLRCGPHAD